MYISEVKISGYRNFRDVTIPLHEGVNVVIGANNAGKSNLLNAITLALNVDGHRRINISDIFRETKIETLKEASPKVRISLIIRPSMNEEDNSEEMGLLSNFISQLDFPYVAQLNFMYHLSANKEQDYVNTVSSLSSHQEIWDKIERNFAPDYEILRWGGFGEPNNDSLRELFAKIDVQFLDAIRDVGRDMYMGYNPLLKDVLNFFIDYDIKSDESKSEEEITSELVEKSKEFRASAEPLMNNILERLSKGKNVILDYVSKIGATFGGGTPDFSGHLSESEMFSVLRLILKLQNLGIEIPATLNGLGYNNLIYISLLLAKMQASADTSYMKRQSKLYSLLLIEEPEAHLHPSMQYQFLNFLKKNLQEHNIKQAIITTHSTQMASAARVEDFICIYSVDYGKISVGYPRLVYRENTEDKKSLAYVQRFLDATRADIFFAHKVIFVEGMSEVLLLPTFAKYLGYDLARDHVLVVNMGGRYYDHFLRLFDLRRPHSIYKKIACLIDRDPIMGRIACYPYEQATDKNDIDERNRKYTSENIRYFSQDEKYGKTLEYDIVWTNPLCELLLTTSITNRSELEELMHAGTIEEMKDILRSSRENNRIINAIDGSDWSDDEKRKAIIASRYLNSLSKGDNALELSMALEKNLKLEDVNPDKVEFNVPTYIKDALEWLFT